MTYQSLNPATKELVATYPMLSSEAMKEVCSQVHETQLAWRDTAIEYRSRLLSNLSQVIRQQLESLAQMITMEMGKPIKQSRAELEKCAYVCEYYCQQAPVFLESTPVATEAQASFISYQPLGVIFAVMPWNFPFWQVLRFLAPALMAGNGGILKHAPNVPGCAQAIERLVLEAGFPENLFRNVFIDHDVSREVIEHPAVQGVTLTGSTRAGRSVAATSGRALKKTVLELGGSDPYLILEDADLDLAVKMCVTSRLINSGQSCVAAKRFVVVDAIYNDFMERFVPAMAAKKMGDPLDESVDIGPLARWDLRDELHEQVQASVAAGAKIALGGEVPDLDGAYYPVTVLTDVTKDTPAYHQELFGPVASVIKVADEDEAIDVANDSIYGLGSAIFTRDIARGQRIAERQIQAGACFINTFVKSDPRLPFGGIKESGYGRELSELGMKEFMNAKTVYIEG